MIGKRSLGLLVGLLALMLAGRAAAPTLHRLVVLNPQLRDALQNQDLPRVARLIRAGADVNLKWDTNGYPRGHSPARWAFSRRRSASLL